MSSWMNSRRKHKFSMMCNLFVTCITRIFIFSSTISLWVLLQALLSWRCILILYRRIHRDKSFTVVPFCNSHFCQTKFGADTIHESCQNSGGFHDFHFNAKIWFGKIFLHCCWMVVLPYLTTSLHGPCNNCLIEILHFRASSSKRFSL